LSASILAAAATYALLRFAICFFSLCSRGHIWVARDPATCDLVSTKWWKIPDRLVCYGGAFPDKPGARGVAVAN
jgi:hypothetical protein